MGSVLQPGRGVHRAARRDPVLLEAITEIDSSGAVVARLAEGIGRQLALRYRPSKLTIGEDEPKAVLVSKILVHPRDPKICPLVVIRAEDVDKLSHRLIVADQQPNIGLLR